MKSEYNNKESSCSCCTYNGDKNCACCMYNDNTFLFKFRHLKYIYLSPCGRLNRRRYWFANIILFILLYPTNMYLAHKLFEHGGWESLSFSPGAIIAIAWMILLTILSVIVSIKRAHDRNRSGHFLWLALLPFINLWPFVELGFIRGTKGGNRFGDDPLKKVKIKQYIEPKMEVNMMKRKTKTVKKTAKKTTRKTTAKKTAKKKTTKKR